VLGGPTAPQERLLTGTQEPPVDWRRQNVEVGGIISAIIVGLILGVVGRALAPGKQHIPVWLTIGVGIVAALIGSAIVGPLNDTDGWDWVELFVQVVLAVIGVMAASVLYGRGKART
jgi:uncharacterized membrane protein YeaQ/YmgE (transglycosylase-associated protein family)